MTDERTRRLAPAGALVLCLGLATTGEEAEDDTREAALEDQGFGVTEQGDVTLSTNVSYGLGGSNAIAQSESRSLTHAVNGSYGVIDRLQVGASFTHGVTQVETSPGLQNGFTESEYGTGSVRLSAAFDAVAEREYVPEITLTPSFSIATQEPDQDAIAQGFSRYHSGGLTVNWAKSFDALTLFGSLGGSATLPRETISGRVRPGETISTSIGSAFTVNPDITLTTSWSFSHSFPTVIDGERQDEGETDSASVSLGATWRLTNTFFMSSNVGVPLKNAGDGTLSLGITYLP
jgi:hypothetical protein